MDDTDTALIAALRRDARASITELAGELGLARATVRARLDRLTATGEIAGFTVVLRSEIESREISAITLIAVEGTGAEAVIRRLRGLAEVRAIHTTNGRWDLVAEIGTHDLEAFDAALARLRDVPGITQTETSILLSTRKRLGGAISRR